MPANLWWIMAIRGHNIAEKTWEHAGPASRFGISAEVSVWISFAILTTDWQSHQPAGGRDAGPQFIFIICILTGRFSIGGEIRFHWALVARYLSDAQSDKAKRPQRPRRSPPPPTKVGGCYHHPSKRINLRVQRSREVRR